MSEINRVIGKLEEFKSWAKEEFKLIRQDIHQLNQFKWKIYGGSAIVSGIFVVFLEVFIKILEK